MESRTFVDSRGLNWRVFEVRPAAGAGSVTPGRENGWLAFAGSTERRRLSPIPNEWAIAPQSELERLCHEATVVAPTTSATHVPVPVDRRQADRRRTPSDGGELSAINAADAVEAAPVDALLDPRLRHDIRAAARAARAARTPAVTALMTMRSALKTAGINADSAEFRAARRLFLDVFYFGAKRD